MDRYDILSGKKPVYPTPKELRRQKKMKKLREKLEKGDISFKTEPANPEAVPGTNLGIGTEEPSPLLFGGLDMGNGRDTLSVHVAGQEVGTIHAVPGVNSGGINMSFVERSPYADDLDSTANFSALRVFGGDVDVESGVVRASDPRADNHLTTKRYVDKLFEGIRAKELSFRDRFVISLVLVSFLLNVLLWIATRF